jgi:hypothetical protein
LNLTIRLAVFAFGTMNRASRVIVLSPLPARVTLLFG